MPGYEGGRPYQPNPVPFDTEGLPRYLSAELDRISNILADLGKMSWGGSYVTGNCYDKGTTVLDSGWTMIANKDTCDKPAPVPIGVPAWTLPETPAWATETVNANTLHTGQRYQYTDHVFLDAIRVWLPVIDDGVFYQVMFILNPDDITPSIVILANWFNNGTVGWNTIAAGSRAVPANTAFEVILATQNRSGQEVVIADYAYQTPNNEAVPSAGEAIHATKGIEYIRFNYTSLTGDQEAFLKSITAGDLIVGAGQSWTVAGNTDAGTYAQIEVNPQVQGVDAIQEFTFTHYAAQAITYTRILNHWAATDAIDGVFDGDVPLAGQLETNNNAYGTDIEWQAADVSDDWDVVSGP